MLLNCTKLMSLILLLLIASSTVIADNIVKTYEFDNVNSLDMYSIVGEISIHQGENAKLLISKKNDLNKPELLKIKVDTSNGQLFIKELIEANNPKGAVYWDVAIPKEHNMKYIKLFSTLKNITLNDLNVDILTCRTSVGNIKAKAITAEEVYLTTSIDPIIMQNCGVSNSIELISAEGNIDVSLPYLPTNRLLANSTLANVTLTVPTFGDNYNLTIMKQENKGQVVCPFEYTDSSTKRIHEINKYQMDCFFVRKGEEEPKIDLITSTGVITISTDIVSNN